MPVNNIIHITYFSPSLSIILVFSSIICTVELSLTFRKQKTYIFPIFIFYQIWFIAVFISLFITPIKFKHGVPRSHRPKFRKIYFLLYIPIAAVLYFITCTRLILLNTLTTHSSLSLLCNSFICGWGFPGCLPSSLFSVYCSCPRPGQLLQRTPTLTYYIDSSMYCIDHAIYSFLLSV